MAFEIILDDAKLMANMCSVISSIVTESRLHIDEEGIKIKAFDATRISMIDFLMKKEVFSKYEIAEETSIGLSLEILNQILKTAKSSERLKLAFDDEAKRFIVDFIGAKRRRSFALSIIDIQADESIPDTINISFDANFRMQCGFLQQVLKDAEMVGDYLRIYADEKGISFESESDTKAMHTFIEPESEEMDTEEFSVLVSDEVPSFESVYSLEFLSNFLKGIRSSDEIEVSFGQDLPVRIIYYIEDKGHLLYFVAPRIEESEDIDDDI